VQAMLALAARHLGRTDLAGWLAARAALLADGRKLVAERSSLGELWPHHAANG